MGIAVQLRRNFIFRPILLRSVIRPFRGLEHTFQFYELVKDYLLDDIHKFNGLSPDKAAEKFNSLFSKKYFEIGDSGNYHAMDYMIKDIHVEWKGLYMYHYENFNETGSKLLTSVICCCPFAQMSRAPIIDQFKKKLGEDRGIALISRLPSKGYDLDSVLTALKDSPYSGFSYWCQWLFAKTKNIWLDTQPYSKHLAWDKRNVNKLTRAWKDYLIIDSKMKEFDKWLKGQFPQHAAEVINYVSSKIGKPLIDVFGEDNDNKAKRN